MNEANENCQEVASTATQTCAHDVCENGFALNNFIYNIQVQFKYMLYVAPQKNLCKDLLSGHAFLSCQDLIDTDSFIKACVKDMCYSNCSSTSCLCSTISEYSHHCAYAGGNPQAWKTAQLCGKISKQSIYMFKLFDFFRCIYIRVTVSKLYFFCVCVEQQKHALSTWSIGNAAVLVLTPAAIPREANCVMITVWMDASVHLVSFQI